MKNYEALKQLVDGAQEDFQKFFEKGQNAAGTRVRKCMQDVKKLAKDIRTEVQEAKNKNKDK
jgi:flagellar biosynthesis/type III secretory pathway protein FliH